MNALRWHAVAVAVVVCAPCLVPGVARAEDWHWRRGERSDLATERGGVAGEVAFGGSRDRFALSPMIGGWVLAADHLVLSLDWGAVFVRNHQTTRNVANPLLSALYTVETEGVRIGMGFQTGLPAARLREDTPSARLVEGSDHFLTAFMRGGWNVWMWTPEMLAGAFPLHVESLREHTHLALDVTFAGALVPEDAERWLAAVQAAGEMGYRDDWGAAGLRLQIVWLANPGGELVQTALEPFLRVAMERAFITVRATLNLDEPQGLAGGGERVWAAHGGAGSTF